MKNSKEKKQLTRLARDVLDFLGHKDAVAEVNLIDARTMKSLNKRFKGKDSSTNVLSFPAPEGFPSIPDKNFPRLLGEVFLNPGYIKNHKENIDYLLIHGLLHLLGFNHKEYDDRIKMERLESEIIIYLLNNS